MASQHDRSTARRKKRLQKRGDRQYFAAVRKIRRRKLDDWQLKHKPERMKMRLTQLTLAAMKRDHKQEARDVEKARRMGEDS